MDGKHWSIKTTYKTAKDVNKEDFLEETFDGRFFYTFSHPPKDAQEKGKKITPHLVITKKDLLAEKTRFSLFYPGANFFQGRGLSFFSVGKLENQQVRGTHDGVNIEASLDSSKDFLMKTAVFLSPSNKEVARIQGTKPVKLDNGVWINSAVEDVFYDGPGEPLYKMTATLIRASGKTNRKSFVPDVPVGTLVEYDLDGKLVSFLKESQKPIVAEEIAVQAKRKIEQEKTFFGAINRKRQEIQQQQGMRIALNALLVSLIVASVCVFVLRLQKSKASKNNTTV